MKSIASFIKASFLDAFRFTRSKEGLKSLYGVSLYRNAVYLMLNSAILAVTGFGFWAVAARLYPEEAIGLSSAAISAMGLLALISTLGLNYGLIRFLPRSGKKAPALMNSCFTISGLISIGLSLIFIIGLDLWSPALVLIREHLIFIVAFVLFTFTSVLLDFTSSIYVAERRTGFALAQGLIFGLLRFIPLLVLAASFTTFGVFASWGLTVAFVAIVGIFAFIPHIQKGFRPFPALRKESVNELLRFSLGNYVANLLWAIPGFVLPLMVVNFLGAGQNAYFYIGWATGSILFIIPACTSLSLFAEGSYNEKKLRQEVKRSLRLILFMLIPAIFIMLLAGSRILLLFGGAYSENATKLLWILAFSALPVSVNHIYFSIKRVEMKMKSVMGLSAAIMAIALILSCFLMPRMGIIGAGIGWLVGHGLIALFVTISIIGKVKMLEG